MRLSFATRPPLLACLIVLLLPATGHGFGSTPLNISIGIGKERPNGASAQPAVSGDNRKVRLVAYSSNASNLVRGDTNNVSDVFVWRRPAHNDFPRRLRVGKLSRVSVSARGDQANGPSSSPSVDGSLHSNPHCVAFQSNATNLARRDALPDSDIYLRDLRNRRTRLISVGVRGEASDPSVSGNCRSVVFVAGGKIYRARVGGGRPRLIGRGSDPALSRDSKSLAYVRDGRVVYRRGSYRKLLTAGSNPRVSDKSPSHGWGVAYDHQGDIKLAVINNGRRSVHTAVENGKLGGVTSRVANIGIIVWTRGRTLFFLNRHTGRSNDLATAYGTITEVAISARSNLIAFAAPGGAGFLDRDANRMPSIYVKWLPK
jgi:hypothetical protein